MPGPTGKKGRPFADARTMVEGIFTGIGAGSHGEIFPMCSRPGRRCGSGTNGWLMMVPGTNYRPGSRSTPTVLA